MNTDRDIFIGSLVAIVTPFKDGVIDVDAVQNLVKWHLDAGTDGIVVTGTTGEVSTLAPEEDYALWETVIETVEGKIPVIAGTGSNDTAHALKASRKAEQLGADGLLVVTPYYNKPTQRGLIAHYSAIADEVGIPICLYSVPGRTAVEIASDTVATLFSSRDNIVALKEAGGSVDRVSDVRRRCGITVLSGDDSLTLPMMAVGAKGVISVAANVVPRDVSDMVRHALSGRWEEARAIHERLYPLMKALFIETNPAPVKAALAHLGLIEEDVRLPLVTMEERNREKLVALLPPGGPGSD